MGAYNISNVSWAHASAGNANVTPSPATVTQGTPTMLTAQWTGLDTIKRWFGVINDATPNASATPFPGVATYFSVN
jgi:hypothetical protein